MGRRPPERKPAFTKIIVTDFQKKLLIPAKFVRLHRGTLARKCILRPTGTQDAWHVRTKQIDDSLYFKKGWKEFAQHHSLGFGDLLVFRYHQDSEFYVDLFDKSCCFKEPAVAPRNVGSQMDTTPILPSQDEEADFETPAFEAHSCEALKARSSHAFQAHSEKALKAANKFSSLSKYPSSPFVVHKSYLRKQYMHVPSTFVKQMDVARGAKKVILQCCGKEWDAVLNTYSSSSKIITGWSTFAKENSLQIGDACVLELINRKAALINVTIFVCTN